MIVVQVPRPDLAQPCTVASRRLAQLLLDAGIDERARRRTIELNSRGLAVDEKQVLIEMKERDGRDSSRDMAPLRKAADAYLIDSSGIPVEEVLRRMMGVIRHDGT